MTGLVDLHTHVLPGLDDGSRSLDMSREMVRQFVADGVDTVVATPHVLHPRFIVEPDSVRDSLRALRTHLLREGVSDFEIVYGAEVRFRSDLGEKPEELPDLTIGGQGKYLLLELPFEYAPPDLFDVVHRLRCRGVTPILAHAERHADLQDDPGLVAEAVRLGSLVQITALSVTGHLGKRERKLARWLMKRGLAHVLASDAHDPVRRPPGLAEALAVARRLLGDERAGALARENPRRIVTGEVVPTAG